MKKSVLLILINTNFSKGESQADFYNYQKISDVAKNFNMYGYRILTASENGGEIMNMNYAERHGFDQIYYTLPIAGLHAEDIANYSAIHIISFKGSTREHIESHPRLQKIFNMMHVTDKIISYEDSENNKYILHPAMPTNKIWCPDINRDGVAPTDMGSIEFTQNIMDLVTLQDI